MRCPQGFHVPNITDVVIPGMNLSTLHIFITQIESQKMVNFKLKRYIVNGDAHAEHSREIQLVDPGFLNKKDCELLGS